MKSGQASQIHQPQTSQTVCTAIRIEIVVLLRSWGIEPSATVGHSSSEIAAAFASRSLISEEAITIAYLRGISVSQKSKKGAMTLSVWIKLL
jgi:acyl transferase domain-containing protein